MTSDIIQFSVPIQQTRFSVRQDRYELRADRGWYWLQRILFSILRRLGCFARDCEIVSSQTRIINTGSFLRRISHQRAELTQRWMLQGERLLLGAEDYRELMQETNLIPGPLSFDIRFMSGCRIHDLRVTIVPWMSGMLVMPRTDSENESLIERNDSLSKQMEDMKRLLARLVTEMQPWSFYSRSTLGLLMTEVEHAAGVACA